jgi:hypothetical protein
MTETYFYEPSKGHGLPHNPFKAIIAPRPIGWISTRDRLTTRHFFTMSPGRGWRAGGGHGSSRTSTIASRSGTGSGYA